MNIEVMAWTSLIAGMSTFIAIKALCWLPLSVRLMIWLLGISLMGFAMIYLVSAYDPKMVQPAIVVAYWIMLVTRLGVPILAVWIVFKYGSITARVLTVSVLLTTACSTRVDNPYGTVLTMGMLITLFLWIVMESFGCFAVRKCHAREESNHTITLG